MLHFLKDWWKLNSFMSTILAWLYKWWILYHIYENIQRVVIPIYNAWKCQQFLAWIFKILRLSEIKVNYSCSCFTFRSSCFQYLGSCAWSHQSVHAQNGTWKFIFWATLMKHTHRPASEEWHPNFCARVNVRRCTCSVCCWGCLKETGNCHENYQNCLRLTHAHLVSCPLRALASA